LYQATKEITKFLISGVVAVMTDFAVYYALGGLFDGSYSIVNGVSLNDIFKAGGFIAGTTVTYNLNKFWTWRQPNKDNKRLMNFAILYFISFLVNVAVNNWGINSLPDNELMLTSYRADGSVFEWIALKTDKFFAFLFSAIASAFVSFLGQKLWVFKPKQ
jgi:putative flippase GtrA